MQESCYLRGVRGLAPALSEASCSELRSFAFQAPICPCRDKAMTLQIRSEKKCGITWRCSACKKRRGFFTDSSFEDSSVPPSTWIVLFYHWANGASKETMAKESGALGGPDMVVEVDETEYGRKRKGVHGKEADPKLDVWGCLDRNSGCVILRDFEKLNNEGLKRQKGPARAEEVLPLVRRYVKKGSFVVSDRLRAYRTQLDRMGYKWHGVNHSDGEFVREVEVQARGKTKILPVHSQSIDSIWRHMKDFLAKNAFRQEDYPSYVEEWQWRHNYQAANRFRMFIFSLTLYPF